MKSTPKGSPPPPPARSIIQVPSAESGRRPITSDLQNPNAPGHRVQDLILYEIHPKGFTASTASAVNHPGTFRGIGEKADYFRSAESKCAGPSGAGSDPL